MKRIGITFTATSFEYYWGWLGPEDIGEDVELVELSFKLGNYQDIPTCDAFILTGGVDVDPSFYGGEESYANRPAEFQIARDRFEAAVYHYAKYHRVPVLGICRGLQLVNVIEGGKLIQDMGEELNEMHRKATDDKLHHVDIYPGSLLHSIVGVESGEVNSAHHQSIDPDSVSDSLRISARSNEVIEAVEYVNPEGKGFMLCVQWHPERMPDKETSALSKNIKRTILQKARTSDMKKFDVINPDTEEVIASLNEDDTVSMRHKLDLLRQGQREWVKKPVEERVSVLKKYAELLAAHIDSLAKTLSEEVGKPVQQAKNEVNGAIARITWLTNNASKYLADEVMSEGSGMKEMIRYEPLGVVCNISAWNYPYLVGTNVFVPALLAGNAVMYKPSEFSSLTGLHIQSYLWQAGVPQNVFQVALGGSSVGEALLDLPFDGYFFTGSYKTGKHIYEKVAPKMVPCQCELGGKDPVYIADDVSDVKAVACGTADGAFYNNGQSCCSVERIYVHERIYDQYIDEFVKEVGSWKIGSPAEEGVYIGPLTRKSQIGFLSTQIRDAVERGAKILIGGKPIEGKGYYFEPTVLVDVTNDMAIMREESFGPVIGIMKVKDDDEAISLMNDTEYGLTAGVYCSDQQRAERILGKIDAGTGYWNCCDRVSAALPWSGRKHSGFGATLSHAGLRAFTKPKAYHLRNS